MESTVRFFDPRRGFGKLHATDATNGEDVFFHHSVVQANSDLVEGELVSFDVDKTAKGFQATHVVRLRQRVRGRVIRFSGFGRIRLDDSEDTLFVHYSDIVGSGFRTLEEDEPVEFEIVDSEKGRKAVRVKRLQTGTALERFAVLDKWADKLALLADALAHKENWDYRHTESRYRHPILNSYLHYTFNRLNEESKVLEAKDRDGSPAACFNTGLATEKQEEIFAYFSRSRLTTGSDPLAPPWFLQGFFVESDRRFSAFSKKPEVANYFSDPSELLYDARLRLQLDIPHIIDENRERFPGVLQTNEYQLRGALEWAIESAKKRVRRNYKSAIPQFHRGRLQLLLPLCLLAPERADLALVVFRDGEVYRGSTVLTLDMAYNNARLLARPDTEWLDP